MNRRAVFARDRRAGWILFAAIIAIAFAIERRVPSFAIFQSNGHFEKLGEHHRGTRARFTDESSLVELVRVSAVRHAGFDLDERQDAEKRRARHGELRALPHLRRFSSPPISSPIWQARWGYFFVLIFALALPALLAPIKSGAAVWIAFVLSMFPILRDWDERLWPNEAQLAGRVERRIESAQIRDLALSLRSPEVHPFLAPWWLSPSIAYWSGQPGVAGSSHESLNGIEESARFFLSEDLQKAREILEKRHVAWVFAYDSDRVAQNSAAILNEPRSSGTALSRFGSNAQPGATVPRFFLRKLQHASSTEWLLNDNR